MNKRLAIMVFVIAATTGFAGIIDNIAENIAFHDNSFEKRLQAKARLLTTDQAVDEISQRNSTPPVGVRNNTPAIIFLTIANTNNVCVWGSGRIIGELINEPFSFAVGAHQTYRMMILWLGIPLASNTNEETHLTIEWEAIFRK